MSGWQRPLQSLRRAPEPLKRRLRPLLVHSVHLLRAMPGGSAGARLVRRLAPGLHAWLVRRYVYYVDVGLGAAAPAIGAGAGGLDEDARMVLGWLRTGDTNRLM